MLNNIHDIVYLYAVSVDLVNSFMICYNRLKLDSSSILVSVYKKEWIYELLNGWINQSNNELNEWMDEQMNEWMSQQIN